MKYRRRQDGQLGELVVGEDGVKRVRIDRPNQELLTEYNEHDWFVEPDENPLTRFHVARIAYEADRLYAMALGDFRNGRKTWESLKDEERIKIRRDGPDTKDNRRLALWKHIWAFKAFKTAK